MSEVFITSDSHFGHRGILSFPCTKPFRQFDTIEEHDEELIKRWNDTVRPKDIVWHLGDFCFGRKNIEIAGRLNGYKRLVMGNHDMYAAQEYLQYFTKVVGCHEYKGLIFSHIPVHPMQKGRFFMNVHGHLHEKWVLKEDGTRDNWYFNASVEHHNLTPIPIHEVYNYWAETQEGE